MHYTNLSSTHYKQIAHRIKHDFTRGDLGFIITMIRYIHVSEICISNSKLFCRYKGRIIYNTRYQESNGGQQQVVAGGGVSGPASQASTSTSSSGATAINGCSAVAGGDSAAQTLR